MAMDHLAFTSLAPILAQWLGELNDARNHVILKIAARHEVSIYAEI
jgi:hypothetical protein